MMRCYHCGSYDLRISRKITVWETFEVRCHPDDPDNYEELDAGNLEDTIDTGDWEEVVCSECDSDLAMHKAKACYLGDMPVAPMADTEEHGA